VEGVQGLVHLVLTLARELLQVKRLNCRNWICLNFDMDRKDLSLEHRLTVRLAPALRLEKGSP